MKITWEKFTVRARHPFKISREVKEIVERVWVRIEADGQEGWGEADPSPYYGETAGTVLSALERMRPVIEAAPGPDGLEVLERSLRDAIGHNGSARAAVSAALHDLAGKRAGLPLWKMWGLEPSEAPLSSFTIGLDQVPRRGAGWYGLPVEATGAWEADDVFVVHIDHIGLIDKEELRVTFADDRVTLEGAWTTLRGQLDQASGQGLAPVVPSPNAALDAKTGPVALP